MSANGQIPASDARINLSIPFATFGAVPFEECEAALDAAGLHEPIYNLVLYRLFGFLDWSKTIRIGEHDFMTGWTGVFSEDALASKINCCGKTARKALHALSDPDIGILKREKVGKTFRYHISLFDKAIAYLKENPPETVRIEYLKSKPSAVKHTTRGNSKAPITEKKSVNQDYLEEKTPIPTGSSTSTGIAPSVPKEGGEDKNSQKAKPPDSSLIQNSSSPDPKPTRQKSTPPTVERRSKVSSSAPPALDVVPNTHIGKVLDTLAEGKQMGGVSALDDNLEEFMKTFKPPDGVVWKWNDMQPAKVLKERIEAKLDAASIEMPPLLFFKHCLQEMENRIQDGKLDMRPSSFNFFLNAATGKEIIEYCIEKLGSKNRSLNQKKRTDALLNEMKKRRATASGPPPEAKAQLDRLLGRT